jgi:hypothetical protein
MQKVGKSRSAKERNYYTCSEEIENTIEGIEEIEESMGTDGGDHLYGDGLANL